MNVQKLLHTCSAHWTIWKIVHIFVQKKIKPTSYQKTSQYLSLLKEYQCARQFFLLFFIFEKAVCTSRREQGVFQTWKIGAKLLLFSSTETRVNLEILRTPNESINQKKSEILGRCGRQNMLRPYLKILDWDWIEFSSLQWRLFLFWASVVRA